MSQSISKKPIIGTDHGTYFQFYANSFLAEFVFKIIKILKTCLAWNLHFLTVK